MMLVLYRKIPITRIAQNLIMQVCYQRVKLMSSRMTKIAIKIKNKTLANPAETEAMLPKPRAAAIIAITKNIKAQLKSPIVLILNKMIF